MMSRVDFYLLENETAKGIFPFSCRLLSKIYSTQDQKILVACNNLEECVHFNRLLWTFNDISFVPHCLASDPLGVDTPIHIGLLTDIAANKNQHSIILNLTNDSCLSPQMEISLRIIEIVSNEADIRQASRKKYLDYKNSGWELYTHKIM